MDLEIFYMSLYGLLVLIHVVAAVVGMGPSFAMPVIQSFGKTKESLVFVNQIVKR